MNRRCLARGLFLIALTAPALLPCACVRTYTVAGTTFSQPEPALEHQRKEIEKAVAEMPRQPSPSAPGRWASVLRPARRFARAARQVDVGFRHTARDNHMRGLVEALRASGIMPQVEDMVRTRETTWPQARGVDYFLRFDYPGKRKAQGMFVDMWTRKARDLTAEFTDKASSDASRTVGGSFRHAVAVAGRALKELAGP